MNITQDIELSILLIILYILIRGVSKNHFTSERGKGSAIVIIIVGFLIMIELNRIIGIITVLGGVAIMLIPPRETET